MNISIVNIGEQIVLYFYDYVWYTNRLRVIEFLITGE